MSADPPSPPRGRRALRLRSLGATAGRNLRARPGRAVLTTAGIVLGVGLIFGVLLLVATIDGTFRGLFDSVYGKADLVVSGASNDERLRGRTLARVRAVESVEEAQGSLQDVAVRVRYRPPPPEPAAGAQPPPGAQAPATGREAERGGEAAGAQTADGDDDGDELNLAAVDPRAPDISGTTLAAGRRALRGREIELEQGWAKEQELAPGERLRLATPTGVKTFTVAGTFRFTRTFGFGGEGFARIPLRTGREVMDKPRGLDEISVVVDDRASLDAVTAAIERRAGPGAEVATPRGKSDDVSEQLQGLNVLLLFFAAMGLVVGGLLIFNAFQITVLQRTRELGMLRTLGARRGAIMRALLREALILGVVGTALGLALGLGLGVGLVALMRAIGFPVGELEPTATALAAAVAGGLVVTLLGALHPAWRAGRVAPIRAVLGIGEARRPPSRWRGPAGAALCALGLAGVFVLASADDISAREAAAGMLGVVLLFVGVATLAPLLIGPAVRVLSWPVRLVFPVEGRLASDAARSNPGRTAATASGLMIGLALVTAFGSLGASFLGSVQKELDRAFARDFTVQPEGFRPGAGRQQSISPRLARRIARLPEAAVVTPERFIVAEQFDGQDGLQFGFDPARYGEIDESEYAGGLSEEQVLAGVARGGVIVGEPLATEEKLKVGDRVTLRGGSGRKRVTVAGIIETSIFGGQTVGMSLRTMEQVYGVTRDSGLAVKAVSAEARPALERRVDAILAEDYPQLRLLSNDELKADIESQVNQQFGFFNALLAVAVLVSLLGVINTLSMNVLERTREIGVLRALGSSRWQVRRAIGEEGLLLSAVGALLGIAVGVLLGYVFVKGVAAAVPTVHYVAPLGTIAGVAAAGVLLGLVAAILPARRAARMNVVRALSYE